MAEGCKEAKFMPPEAIWEGDFPGIVGIIFPSIDGGIYCLARFGWHGFGAFEGVKIMHAVTTMTTTVFWLNCQDQYRDL